MVPFVAIAVAKPDDREAIAERFPLEYAIPTLLGDSYRGHPVMATTGMSGYFFLIIEMVF